MEKQQFQIKVSDTIGEVSAELTTGDTTRAILTLAHGAGAGMNHNFMTTLSHTLAEEGIGTLRFNFPFMEQKKKRVDLPAVAHKAIEAAMRKANDLFPTVPLFASGKSFGGRMSSQYLSTHSPDFVKGIIFFGFPLHPAGQPATDRAEHLKNVKVPMLFLQGTRDELAHWALIEKVTSELPLATLVKIEGADHSFKAGKQSTMAWMVKAASDWIALLSEE